MMKRRVAGLAIAIFLASGLSFAGTVDSYVTTLGNAENMWVHYWGAGGSGTFWNGWTLGNDAAHSYSLYCSPCSGQETQTYTWLEIGLPALSGNITSAFLYIDVLSYSTDDGSGIYAALSHTGDASSATGDATQGLSGDQFVQNIAPGSTGWLGLDVTSFISGDYANHYSWAAFQFGPYAGNPTNSDFSFGTAEPPTVLGDPPYLEITTDANTGVPEPATLSVTGAVLLALGLVSRRRKR